MKHQKSNEENLSSNRIIESSIDANDEDLENVFEPITNTNMMADSSFDASVTAKMLMSHELSATTNTSVGQHSFHGTFNNGTSSFYHGTPATVVAASATGFNGFHNSTFHNYSHNNLNGISTTTTSATTSFNTLAHQHPITLSNHHPVTTVISSTMPPPLIPYNQSSFYTSCNNLSNTNEIGSQQRKENAASNVGENKNKSSEHVTTTEELTTTTTTTSTEEIVANENIIQAEEAAETEEPEIDIVISNVVCAFSVRCHLSLKEIALHGSNVEYKRENGMVTMKLRKPYTTASIWSSGKITCTGATSEEQAKIAARRYARMLQKLNFRVRFQNYRVVNVLGTCKMPWAIKIVQFSEKFKKDASYEPELHPGVTYNLKNPTATLKIFSTGSMTVTARSVADVQAAIEHIYPLVYEFKKPRTDENDEEFYAEIIETDVEGDDDDDDDEDEIEDPLEDPLDTRRNNSPPPVKRQKLRDVSHLTKRYKGKPIQRRPKRPLGKMNDPKQDLMYVSDGDIDGDDFE